MEKRAGDTCSIDSRRRTAGSPQAKPLNNSQLTLGEPLGSPLLFRKRIVGKADIALWAYIPPYVDREGSTTL